MSDRDALLAAVLAAPDDDLPRLVFADHLDESGHPADAARAQFIRLQIEADRHAAGTSAHTTLVRAAAALRSQFVDEVDLLKPVHDPQLASGWLNLIRRRGFVDEVRFAPELLALVGYRLFAVAPIRTIRLPWFGNGNDWLFEGRFLNRAETLVIDPYAVAHEPNRRTVPGSSRTFDVAFQPLLQSAHLTGLRELQVAKNRLDNNWLIQFVHAVPQSAFAATLRVLDLSGNDFTDAGANLLIATDALDRLDRLLLVGNRITVGGANLLRRRFGERVVL